MKTCILERIEIEIKAQKYLALCRVKAVLIGWGTIFEADAAWTSFLTDYHGNSYIYFWRRLLWVEVDGERDLCNLV